MSNFKEKVCKVSGHKWKQYNSLQKCPCSLCVESRENLKKGKIVVKARTPVKKVSDKRKVENLQYAADRIVFLNKPENRICPVTGQRAKEVHHMRKRRGYADELARLNNIPLLLDQRFWLAVSRDGHEAIENNPEWAYEKGYSIKNNSK